MLPKLCRTIAQARRHCVRPRAEVSFSGADFSGGQVDFKSAESSGDEVDLRYPRDRQGCHCSAGTAHQQQECCCPRRQMPHPTNASLLTPRAAGRVRAGPSG
jgi:hypothetical protein